MNGSFQKNVIVLHRNLKTSKLIAAASRLQISTQYFKSFASGSIAHWVRIGKIRHALILDDCTSQGLKDR